jgi:ketosteroid isomerase-like protein
MDSAKIDDAVAAMARALQTRDYDRFTSFFTASAVMEIPFTADGGDRLNGLAAIKEHFERVRRGPLGTLIEIEEVSAETLHAPNSVVTVQYFMRGKSVSTKESFFIQSSIAVIRFNDDGIVHYKDFPNTIGIAKRAGVLSQLAASWSKAQ